MTRGVHHASPWAVRLARAPGSARAKLRLLGQSGQEKKNSCRSEPKGVCACAVCASCAFVQPSVVHGVQSSVANTLWN
eukprot:14398276-Alexandrium_andersonii.AAC.1